MNLILTLILLIVAIIIIALMVIWNIRLRSCFKKERERFEQEENILKARIFVAYKSTDIFPMEWNRKKHSMAPIMRSVKKEIKELNQDMKELSLDYILQNVHPDDRDGLRSFFAELDNLKGSISAVYRYDVNGNFNKYFRVTFDSDSIIGDGDIIIGCGRDITDEYNQ